MAGACRQILASVALAFLPVYFQRAFPAHKAQYAVINAMTLISCGFLSNILGSIICTKLEKRTHLAKSLVTVGGNLIGIPFFAATCLTTSFPVAIFCNFMHYLFMSYYLAPSITLMQSSTSPKNAGLVISVETFFAFLVGTVAPLIFGSLANSMGAL